MVSIGPVRNVILLGASDSFSAFRTLCEANGVKCIVITSPDQQQATPKMSADIVTEDISSRECADKLKSLLRDGEMIALSFGARWILKQKVRDTLFRGLVLNAHGTRLPNDRGGGGFSWRIMRGDRIGNLVLHQIDDGIDTGPIVLNEEYIVPRYIQTPVEHERYYLQELTVFICGFLKTSLFGTLRFRRRSAIELRLQLLSAAPHADAWLDRLVMASFRHRQVHSVLRQTISRRQDVLARQDRRVAGLPASCRRNRAPCVSREDWSSETTGNGSPLPSAAEHCLLVSDVRDEAGTISCLISRRAIVCSRRNPTSIGRWRPASNSRRPD